MALRVVIAAGGTAGHIMPALALAEELRSRGHDVSFVGVGGRAGSGIPEQYGYPEDHVPLRGFDRRLSLRNLRTALQAALAVPRMMKVLRHRHADVVVGGGGYMAGPAAIAGRLTRRRVVLTEADSRFGLANRLAAPFAKRVALAFPIAGRTSRKYVVTGRPVGRAVRDANRADGRRRLGLAPTGVCVLVAGGSQGAQSINDAALGAFCPSPPFEVVHVAGARNEADVRERAAEAGGGPRYHVYGFLDDYPAAVAAADLVISRSGGSVFELAAIGRPSILIPYPHATADHQTGNAQWLADAGAAILLPDSECTADRLKEIVGALLVDRHRLEAMGEAARHAARPDAAERIADLVQQVARR
jgi:UDP-N-acetylglucosamine--N-acetylmuramyl-(pentapeptide) pyrophosphoryl-undecaprenol N-acetylglucosamine transferase